MCEKISPQSQAFYAAQEAVRGIGQTTQGITGNIGRPSLLELEQKKLAYLQEQVSRQEQLVELVKKHPEYEDYAEIDRLRNRI